MVARRRAAFWFCHGRYFNDDRLRVHERRVPGFVAPFPVRHKLPVVVARRRVVEHGVLDETGDQALGMVELAWLDVFSRNATVFGA